ncbi:MAG: hypothetical protein CME71_03715 [Halobacteriovorax sp.]|nr:hypothetical protein [Halobacteriovorax sp.]
MNIRHLIYIFALTVLVSFNVQAAGASCEVGPEAYLPVSAQTTATVDGISGSVILQGAMDCGWGVLKGAWDATGGLVSSAASCVWSPIECAQSARAAFNNAKNFITNIVEETKSVMNGISALPAAEKVNLICSIIGSIGADVILAILTGGIATGKLGLTMARIVHKVTQIAGIFRKVAYLPAKHLGKMSKAALTKVDEMVELGFGPMLQRRLRSCM